MQHVPEQLEALDQARAGAGEVRGRVDGDHAARSQRREPVAEVVGLLCGTLGVVAARHDDHDLGAGGLDVLGMPGEHSERRTWEELQAARPEVVIVMPCGYGVERGHEEALAYGDELAELGAERIVVADAAAWFSRPGPRLVDGLEWLGHVLHPDRVPPVEVREVAL